MKFLVNDSLIEILKNNVLRKAGIANLTSADCKTLATEISDHTGFIISETTLKRVFNFAARNHELSLFTLNTLAIFAGYADWNSYAEITEPLLQSKDSRSSAGDLLRQRCQAQSFTYLRMALKHARLSPEQIVINSAINKKLKQFLAGNCVMTGITSPVQSGKTATVAGWPMQYFGQPSFQQETAMLLINATQLYSFLNANISLEEWLVTFLALPHAETLCNEAMTLIVDSFDERSFSREKLKILYQRLYDACLKENISYSLKIVVITRPSVWCELAADHRATLDASPSGIIESLPLLTASTKENEVFLGLMKAGIDQKDIKQFSEQLITLLRYPLYLNEFANAFIKNGDGIGKTDKLLMDTVAAHLNEKLVFSNQQKAKKSIIALVGLKLMEGSPLHYDELPADEPHFRAFYELIDEYILKEYGNSDIFRNELRVTFTDPIVAGYFISRQFIDQQTAVLSKNAVYTATDDPELQQWIYRWRLYSIADNLSTFQPGSLDELFSPVNLSAKQKLDAFDFLIHLHDPDQEFINLLKNVNSRFGLLNLFFQKKLYLDYFSASKIHFLKVLISICEDDRMLHDLLSLLFLVLAYKNNEQHMRDLQVFRRLPVITDNIYTERSVMIETVTDMLLYKIVNLHEPEFIADYLRNAVQSISQGQDAAYHINILLFQLYFDAGSQIQPNIFRTIRMLPVSQQDFYQLPYAAMLVTAFVFLLQPPADIEIAVLEKHLTKMNAAETGYMKTGIMQCLLLSTRVLVMQAAEHPKEAGVALTRLTDLASKHGWRWFASTSIVHQQDLFENNEQDEITKSNNHRSA